MRIKISILILISVLLFFVANSAHSQQFTEQTGISLTGVGASSVAWGDYDNDGDLDILLTGWINSSLISKIYRNNGDNSFTEQMEISLTGIQSGSADWGDYDNDGDLDILLTGESGDNNPVTKIYRNNGNNTFTEQTEITLTDVWMSSATWGDYDNDGDLDILLTGESSDYTGVSKIYHNNGDNSFTEQTETNLTGVYMCSVAWGDYDNDGDLDILLTGAGYLGSPRYSKIYRNNGDNSFTEQTGISLTGVSYSSVAWGDCDNDGDLDILLTGAVSDDNHISKVYRNNGNNSFIEQTGINLTGVRSSSVAWGDYDNDGNLDILLTGFNNSITSISKIYHNNGDNSFTEQTGISLTGVVDGSVSWGDYDNDGDLDILLTGRLQDGTYVSKIYRNNNLTPNSVPTAPSGLTASVADSNVTFSWNKSTDGETPQNGLTYNLYVSTTPGGCQVKSPMADNSTGYRKVVQLGNMNHRNSYTLKGLPEGKYYWSVQAIDNVFAGSAFAPVDSFVILPPVPTITSFSPTSGPIGTIVTITGTNFSPTAANNIVYFGAVKATVTTATSTSLSVIVPTGATYQPITVTTDGLTGYSARPFIVTFKGGGNITSTIFSSKANCSTGTDDSYLNDIAISDLDGDGKSDLVVTNDNSGTVSVFRNTAISGSITNSSFATRVDFAAGIYPGSIAIGDLDGDGKPDMAVTIGGSNKVSVYRNTSVSGNITSSSFAAKVDFAIGGNPSDVAIGDLDGDGKPEIAVTNFGGNSVSVLRNTSITGSINNSSFAGKVDFTAGTQCIGVAIGDLDRDGKPDLVVANDISNTVSVFRNTSVSGSITSNSFAEKVDFATIGGSASVAISDLDGDGKHDLVAINTYSNTISVFRNTAITGSINSSSFDAGVDFATATRPRHITVGDLDGDGKPDLVVTNVNSNTVSVFRNTCVIGSIISSSFIDRIEFATGSSRGIAIGDLDGDGKPDLTVLIVNPNLDLHTISVYRNNIVLPAAPQNLTALSGNQQVTLLWQKNTESDFLRYRIYGGTSANPTTKIDSTIGGILDTVKVITELTNGTTYYFRVTAVDDAGYESEFSNEVFSIPVEMGTVADIDGNIYRTVKIGNQWWMAENLKVAHYRNGDAIPNVTDNTTWSNLNTGAYCNYNNDVNNATVYGRLYNWYSVTDNRNIAPSGWHEPTDTEWQTLVDYLGGESVAGGKMKETGTTHWQTPNTGATNESGFSALPGGYRDYNGTYGWVGYYGAWWSATMSGSDYAWGRNLGYDYSDFYRGGPNERYGFSVRCVRDSDTICLGAPQNLTAQPSNQQVTLCWQKNTEDDFLRYRIYGGTSTNPTSKIDSTTGGILDTVKVITGLTNYQKYYFCITAVDSAGNESVYSNEVSATPCEIITDYDGNTYQTVKIGDQIWMKENLKVTHYRNGDAIPNVTDNSVWRYLITCAYCNYDNDINNATTYGRLYNWYVVNDSRNVAPEGWHISSDAEWQILIDYLGGSGIAGSKMKEIGTVNWASPNSDATNESGFSALPGGDRYNGGIYVNIGSYGLWWSATENSSGNAWNRSLHYASSAVDHSINDKQFGFSVRCVKDSETICPGAPKNLTVQPSNQQVTLSWQKNTESDFLRYRIYGGTSANPTTKIDSTIGGILDTMKVITGLMNGTTYYFRITAVDSVGNESGFSNEVSATPVVPMFGEYLPDINTVLLMHLNETSGSIITDASSYMNNGTATMPTFKTGKFGGAVAFSSSSGRITVPSNSNFNFGYGSFTIDFWFYYYDLGGPQVLLSKRGQSDLVDNSYYIGASQNYVWGTIGKSGVNISTSLSTGRWYHVAIIRSSDSLFLFLNGRLESTNNDPASFLSNSSDLVIGNPLFGAAYWTACWFDEVRVSNTARSPEEFNLQLPPTNLITKPSRNCVLLNWQNGGGAVPLMYYKVFRGTDSTNVSFIDSTTKLFYQDSSFALGTLYYYRISAVDSTGFESAFSNAVTGGFYALKLQVGLATSGEQSGEIPIQYQISGYPFPVGLIGKYQSSPTDSWHLAHITGDTSQIEPENFSGSLIWNSTSDLIDVDLPSVNFRLTCYSYSYTPSVADTLTFHLDNFHTQKIVLSMASQSEFSSDVAVNYVITDATNDTLKLRTFYSTSGTSWSKATIAEDSTGYNPSKYTGTIHWKSSADLAGQDLPNVYLKVVPNDGWADGIGDTTAAFHLDNNQPPTANLADLTGTEYSGEVTLNYVLTDAENNTLSFSVYYLDTVWKKATVTGDTSGIVSAKYSGSVVWKSATDIPTNDLMIRLKLVPRDNDSGSADSSTNFHLDNNLPPSVAIAEISGEKKDAIPITFTLADTENDTLAITCDYLDPATQVWKPATVTGQTSGITSYTACQITWQSKSDLPTTISNVLFRLIPADKDVGLGDSVNILLDNIGAPAVAITNELSGEQSGDISIAFQVSDDEGDAITLTPEYSSDSGTNWSPATVSGKTTGLTQSEYSGALIWHSAQDAPGIDKTTVRFRLTPADAHSGLSYETADFHLDNNQPPGVSVNLDFQEVSGDVTLPIVITDAENDSIRLEVFYSQDQTNWQSASMNIAGKFGQSDYSGDIVWYSEADLPRQDIAEVWLKITCQDIDSGIGDTLKVHLDNQAGPKVQESSPEPNSPSLFAWIRDITVTFDRDIDTSSVSGQIELVSRISGALNFTYHFTTKRSLAIDPTLDFVSLDTISVTLRSGIRDEYGVTLDGNQNGDPDGSPADDWQITFRTTLLGDYNLDKQVTLSDFEILRNAWLSSPPDYSYELGPVAGTLPHYRLTRDGKFNIYDLASLGTMWNWYFENHDYVQFLAKTTTNQESPINISTSFNKGSVWNSNRKELTLDLDLQANTDLVGMEYVIDYNPEEIEYQGFVNRLPRENIADWLILDKCLPEKGQIGVIAFCFGKTGAKSPATITVGSLQFESKTASEAEIAYTSTLSVQAQDTNRIIAKQARYRFSTKPPTPERFALHPAFPNPFNQSTTIRYEIPKETFVRIVIYNLNGEVVSKIAESSHQPGYYEARWNGMNQRGNVVSSGIYFVRMATESYLHTQKILLMK